MRLSPISLTLSATIFISPLVTTADDGRFVIQVDNENKGAVKALAKQRGGRINLEGEGFLAVTFDETDLARVKGLLNNPHIKLVEHDYKRSLLSLYQDDPGNPMTTQVTPYAIYQSQADLVALNKGAGIKVCVIDSGLDNSNQDFNWAAITGDNDSGTGNWFEHGGPHGTHVAGTIAAENNTFGVIGMAPGVDLHIIKVFNENGWGYSSDLAYAANKCSSAGANIISMSLGGGGANSTESSAFESFSDNGGLVLAAAGNDGNTSRSYPAGYSSVMMIGANDADNQIASFSQFPNCETGRGKRKKFDDSICVEVTAGGVGTLSTYPAGMANMASTTLDVGAIAVSSMENNGTAYGATYFMGTAEAIDYAANGAICVIDRGNITFHDKVLNCQNSGGIGAIIVNNEPGMLYGTLGSPNNTNIPSVGAALEDRTLIMSASTADLSIGTSDYGFMDGTSMATPAVAGVAALVWSNFPECTGQEIRTALKASALDSGASGHDVYFGYGITQAKAAADFITNNPCSGGDNGGGTDPEGINLSADGYKSRGVKYVNLTWNGATSTDVDIYRDGVNIVTTSNDGEYTDTINTKGGGTYSYQLCEQGTSNCSQNQAVAF
jgi:subtilisin family serine protease